MSALITNNQRQTKILRWIGSVGALALLVILIRNQGWAEILSAFRKISLWRFSLCLLIILVSRFAVVGRWYALLSAVEDFSFWQSLRITFAGLFASNFLPTTVGGDVVRFAGTVQLHIDGALSAASLIVDRLIGMFGMALALPFGAGQLLAWLVSGQNTQAFGIGSVFFSWGAKMWSKGGEILKRIARDIMLWSKHPKVLLLSFFFTAVHMLCLFGAITLLLDDVGEPLSLGVVGGLWSFVYFVTLLPISINGYGIQEISMAFIFSEVGGISLQNGLTVSILFRLLMLLGSVPGVVFIPGIIAGIKGQEKS